MRTAWTKTVYETKARSVMGTVRGIAQQEAQKLHGWVVSTSGAPSFTGALPHVSCL